MLAAGVQRKATTPAISSGVTNLPVGDWASVGFDQQRLTAQGLDFGGGRFG
jgi:hypothetical protein